MSIGERAYSLLYWGGAVFFGVSAAVVTWLIMFVVDTETTRTLLEQLFAGIAAGLVAPFFWMIPLSVVADHLLFNDRR